MDQLLLAGAIVLSCAAVMALLGVAAVRIRRHGRSGPAIGAAMAAYDEAMHASAHDSYVEQRDEADRGQQASDRRPLG